MHEKKKSGTPPPLEVETDDVAAVLNVFKKLLETHPDLYGFYFATVTVAKIQIGEEILSFTSDVQADDTRVHYVGAIIWSLEKFREMARTSGEKKILKEAETAGASFIGWHPKIHTALLFYTEPPSYKLP